MREDLKPETKTERKSYYNHKYTISENTKELNRAAKEAKEAHMTYGKYYEEQQRKQVKVVRKW